MKLRDDFLRQLQALVGQTNQQIVVTEAARTVRCEVDRCDPLGAAITSIVLETGELATADVATLEEASKSLCRRVTYLLEPISPIEIDADGCMVQMRSSPPQKQDDSRRYYELSLRRGGCVALCRYEKQPGTARTVVPAALTHEVMGRLIEDFDTTVEEVIQN